LQTITNLIGRPLGGWMSDRIGSRAVIILCMMLHAVALILLAFANALWMLASFALLNGLAWGARVPVIVSIRAEYFGSKSFGAIMGISSSVVTVAAVIAPVLAAVAYDALGSYTISFVILAVLAALGSLFMVFTPPPQARAPRPTEATLAH
jgi:MFS family permease